MVYQANQYWTNDAGTAFCIMRLYCTAFMMLWCPSLKALMYGVRYVQLVIRSYFRDDGLVQLLYS